MSQTLNVRAIVLARQDVGEADRRLVLLTSSHGKLYARARGARRASAKFAGVSEPLSLSDFQLAEGKAGRVVTQAVPVSMFPGLRREYARIAFAMSLAEAASKSLEESDSCPTAFEILNAAFQALENHPRPLVVAVWGHVSLMREVGFQPSFMNCVDSGERLKGDFGWVSPMGGGLVSESFRENYEDRIRTTREVLIGLDRISQLDDPPPNLKFAAECFQMVARFWHCRLESKLTALEAAIGLLS